MSEINYPKGTSHPVAIIKKKERTKRNLKVQAGNRGLDFEDAINQTNEYYKEKGLTEREISGNKYEAKVNIDFLCDTNNVHNVIDFVF